MDTNYEPIPQNAGPAEPPADDAQRAAIARGHETTDVGVRGLFIFAGSLFVALFAICAGIILLFKGYGVMDHYLDKHRAEGEPGSNSLVRVQPDYQGPLLQVRPEQDLHRMQQANAGDLRGYAWVDRGKGIVRVPIDRAMELVAERGLPEVSPGITVEQMQQQRADPQVYGQSLRP